MSFRSRLVLFFVIIVVIPMIAVTLVLSQLVSQSEVGRADSQLAEALQVAIGLYEQDRRQAVGDLRRFARQRSLRQAFVDRDTPRLRRTASRAVRADDAVESIVLYGRAGRRIAAAGAPRAIAHATATTTDRDGDAVGQVAVSTTTARRYARELSRLTDLETRVVRRGRAIAGTIADVHGGQGLATSVTHDEGKLRGRYAEIADAVGPPVSVGVFQDAEAIASEIAEDRTLVIAILAGFFFLAVGSSLLVARSLGTQVERFLQVARRVGRGDFTARVPAKGRDEFAALGREFNQMSERLEQSVDELEHRRREREDAIRTVGEAFATGLDRGGIARLAARTALEACSAEVGRTTLVHAEPRLVGRLDERLRGAIASAERLAHETPGETAVAGHDGAHALASSLHAAPRPDGRRDELGMLAIARRERGFEKAEVDLFTYLAAQASVSLDHARLYETVQAQAVTDPLTGLQNRRRFATELADEIGRARRFDSDVGLVMMDLDDFKAINDRFGHQQGDHVLVEVAKLLRQLTRDVDGLARFGGDEIAIILPQTDAAGTELLAERVRERVATLPFRPPGAREPLYATASFGAAAFPESGSDLRTLVRSADNALYRAKRAGGNRVVRGDTSAIPR